MSSSTNLLFNLFHLEKKQGSQDPNFRKLNKLVTFSMKNMMNMINMRTKKINIIKKKAINSGNLEKNISMKHMINVRKLNNLTNQ